MLNKTIPFYNIILKCERYIPTNILLPFLGEPTK